MLPKRALTAYAIYVKSKSFISSSERWKELQAAPFNLLST